MNDTLQGVLYGLGAGLQGFVTYVPQQQTNNNTGVPADAGIPVNVKADKSWLVIVAVIAAVILFKK